MRRKLYYTFIVSVVYLGLSNNNNNINSKEINSEPQEKTGENTKNDDDINMKISNNETKQMPDNNENKITEKTYRDTATSSHSIKNKEISWKSCEYQQIVRLQEFTSDNQARMLEGKASIGPCFRPSLPFAEPSGIMICLPKKSTRNINGNTELKRKQSGISIVVSRKNLSSKSQSDQHQIKIKKLDKELKLKECRNEQICEEMSHLKFFVALREKIDTACCKIKTALKV